MIYDVRLKIHLLDYALILFDVKRNREYVLRNVIHTAIAMTRNEFPGNHDVVMGLCTGFVDA